MGGMDVATCPLAGGEAGCGCHQTGRRWWRLSPPLERGIAIIVARILVAGQWCASLPVSGGGR